MGELNKVLFWRGKRGTINKRCDDIMRDF